MTFETAQQLSLDLARAGFPHTLAVGRHDHVAHASETSLQGIHCRVDVGFPRRHALQLPREHVGTDLDPPLSARISLLEDIGGRLGLVLETGIMGEGLTFSEASSR